MEIKDRIRMVIDSHKLSAGAFADKIGVQRSNVSHVLSGRNKPGFEFLEKIVLAFPKVQAHWLLTGKHAAVVSAEFRGDADPKLIVRDEDPPVYAKPATNAAIPGRNQKKVVKIVTFYSDFTFDCHYPSVE